MLRVDLKAAKIEYKDASDRYFDFHCLRGEFATLLDAGGANQRTTQSLMRHSDARLTSRYIRPRVADLDLAVESLPTPRPSEDRSGSKSTA